jgi:hypothetical protein
MGAFDSKRSGVASGRGETGRELKTGKQASPKRRSPDDLLHGPRATQPTPQVTAAASVARRVWSAAMSAVSLFESAATSIYRAAKYLTLTGALLLGIFLVCVNRAPVAKGFVDIVSHMQEFDAFGVKLTLTPKAIGDNFVLALDPDDKKATDETWKKRVAADVHGLNAELYDRLMAVGSLRETCESSSSDAAARHYAYLDKSLARLGLVEMADAPGVKENVLTKLGVSQQVENGLPQRSAYPERCYNLKLTEHGFDAKTALVRSFAHYVEQFSVSKLETSKAGAD